jgi:hypothetical protein
MTTRSRGTNGNCGQVRGAGKLTHDDVVVIRGSLEFRGEGQCTIDRCDDRETSRFGLAGGDQLGTTFCGSASISKNAGFCREGDRWLMKW